MLLGTVPLEGTVATFSTAALPMALFAITATYNGAADFTGSQDTLVQSVEPSRLGEDPSHGSSLRVTVTEGPPSRIALRAVVLVRRTPVYA